LERVNGERDADVKAMGRRITKQQSELVRFTGMQDEYEKRLESTQLALRAKEEEWGRQRNEKDTAISALQVALSAMTAERDRAINHAARWLGRVDPLAGPSTPTPGMPPGTPGGAISFTPRSASGGGTPGPSRTGSVISTSGSSSGLLGTPGGATASATPSSATPRGMPRIHSFAPSASAVLASSAASPSATRAADVGSPPAAGAAASGGVSLAPSASNSLALALAAISTDTAGGTPRPPLSPSQRPSRLPLASPR